VQIPDPRRHLVRYCGAYSNRARGQRRKAEAQLEGTRLGEAEEPVPPPPQRAALRRRWANLIRRVYPPPPESGTEEHRESCRPYKGGRAVIPPPRAAHPLNRSPTTSEGARQSLSPASPGATRDSWQKATPYPLTRVAWVPSRRPMATIHPSRTATSAWNHGAPVPSTTRPPRNSRS